MRKFDYGAPAELFTGRSMRGSRPMRYHRFDTGAEAIRFAVEALPADQLLATVLKIDEERYRHGEIRALYEASAYPLPRKRADDEAKPVKPVKAKAVMAATAKRKPADKSRSAA